MKTLFVDFDGTICHDRFWRSLDTIDYNRIQKVLFQENPALVADWMKGKYSSEEINRFVAKETGTEYDLLWNIFQNDCKTMNIDSQIFALLKHLRAHYHLVLITANMDCFNRFTVPALHLENYFDVIVNSWNERQLKTDNNGESFIKYLQGPIEQSYLIEDSPHSCKTFTELGGTALQVTSDNTAIFHLEQLIALATIESPTTPSQIV
jgi:FMN phosphatase YigB (HAD superfamily)